MPLFGDLGLYYGPHLTSPSYYSSPFLGASGRTSGLALMPAPRLLPSRMGPLLPSIPEMGALSQRRLLPAMDRASSPRGLTRYLPPKPVHIDTADIDVSSSRFGQRREREPAPAPEPGRQATIKRGRTVVRLHTKRLKENPALDNRRRLTPGEKLVQKFLIVDKAEEKAKEERRRRLEEQEELERVKAEIAKLHAMAAKSAAAAAGDDSASAAPTDEPPTPLPPNQNFPTIQGLTENAALDILLSAEEEEQAWGEDIGREGTVKRRKTKSGHDSTIKANRDAHEEAGKSAETDDEPVEKSLLQRRNTVKFRRNSRDVDGFLSDVESIPSSRRSSLEQGPASRRSSVESLSGEEVFLAQEKKCTVKKRKAPKLKIGEDVSVENGGPAEMPSPKLAVDEIKVEQSPPSPAAGNKKFRYEVIVEDVEGEDAGRRKSPKEVETAKMKAKTDGKGKPGKQAADQQRKVKVNDVKSKSPHVKLEEKSGPAQKAFQKQTSSAEPAVIPKSEQIFPSESSKTENKPNTSRLQNDLRQPVEFPAPQQLATKEVDKLPQMDIKNSQENKNGESKMKTLDKEPLKNKSTSKVEISNIKGKDMQQPTLSLLKQAAKLPQVDTEMCEGDKSEKKDHRPLINDKATSKLETSKPKAKDLMQLADPTKKKADKLPQVDTDTKKPEEDKSKESKMKTIDKEPLRNDKSTSNVEISKIKGNDVQQPTGSALKQAAKLPQVDTEMSEGDKSEKKDKGPLRNDKPTSKLENSKPKAKDLMQLADPTKKKADKLPQVDTDTKKPEEDKSKESKMKTIDKEPLRNDKSTSNVEISKIKGNDVQQPTGSALKQADKLPQVDTEMSEGDKSGKSKIEKKDKEPLRNDDKSTRKPETSALKADNLQKDQFLTEKSKPTLQPLSAPNAEDSGKRVHEKTRPSKQKDLSPTLKTETEDSGCNFWAQIKGSSEEIEFPQWPIFRTPPTLSDAPAAETGVSVLNTKAQAAPKTRAAPDSAAVAPKGEGKVTKKPPQTKPQKQGPQIVPKTGEKQSDVKSTISSKSPEAAMSLATKQSAPSEAGMKKDVSSDLVKPKTLLAPIENAKTAEEKLLQKPKTTQTHEEKSNEAFPPLPERRVTDSPKPADEPPLKNLQLVKKEEQKPTSKEQEKKSEEKFAPKWKALGIQDAKPSKDSVEKTVASPNLTEAKRLADETKSNLLVKQQDSKQNTDVSKTPLRPSSAQVDSPKATKTETATPPSESVKVPITPTKKPHTDKALGQQPEITKMPTDSAPQTPKALAAPREDELPPTSQAPKGKGKPPPATQQPKTREIPQEKPLLNWKVPTKANTDKPKEATTSHPEPNAAAPQTSEMQPKLESAIPAQKEKIQAKWKPPAKSAEAAKATEAAPKSVAKPPASEEEPAATAPDAKTGEKEATVPKAQPTAPAEDKAKGNKLLKKDISKAPAPKPKDSKPAPEKRDAAGRGAEAMELPSPSPAAAASPAERPGNKEKPAKFQQKPAADKKPQPKKEPVKPHEIMPKEKGADATKAKTQAKTPPSPTALQETGKPRKQKTDAVNSKHDDEAKTKTEEAPSKADAKKKPQVKSSKSKHRSGKKEPAEKSENEEEKKSKEAVKQRATAAATAAAAVAGPSSGSESSSEESSSEDEGGSTPRAGTSFSSDDSGFDSRPSSVPGSPPSNKKDCDVNCHRKCEKLMPHLCGVNQKLIVEALTSLKRASEAGREPGSPAPALATSPSLDPYSEDAGLPRSASGRHTPPATSLPRFRKYTIDDFQFLKVLGKGSFGKVLLAELRGTERYYAVKCLKKDVVLEDDDVECTLIERKVLALGTKHPYLCHLFCTFQTERGRSKPLLEPAGGRCPQSHLLFVMECLNGGDLMFHIQQSGRFPELRARFYGAEIVCGLKFLHKKGIVYRDLKLDNILLDYEGHVRIADFGMCKLQIFLDRTADTFCGTPDYMAPEIIKGLKYNQCVDWWSFGVLMFEMLVGVSPFSGCDEDELFWSICNEQPQYPRFLSREAHSLLQQLLEKDAVKRLSTPEGTAGDVCDQVFFRSVDWGALERRELEPPFRPRLKHPLDVQYFDKAFTAECARLTPVDPGILQSMDQAQFQGFSYTNPNATD